MKLPLLLSYCQSNLWIKIKNMMMHGMCSWLMFCFCQCWWGVGHEWCWRPAQAPTTDHPNLTDQHTQCLAMYFNEKRFSLLSPKLTNTWSIHGGRTFQQPSCCPSDHPFRMTTTEVGGATDHWINQLTSDYYRLYLQWNAAVEVAWSALESDWWTFDIWGAHCAMSNIWIT